MKSKISFVPIMTLFIAGIGGNGSLGVAMASTLLVIVFAVMLALYFIFKLVSWLHTLDIRNKIKNMQGVDKAAVITSDSISGEVNAAIVMTLFLYQNELHDIENTVLTIKKVSRAYSPWSSKIYGLRRSPRQ